MARERITPSKEFVDNVIQSLCADSQPKIYRGSRKTKEAAAKEQPKFDVDSINLNILGDEDDTPNHEEESVPSDNKVANASNAAKATEATDAAKVIGVKIKEVIDEPISEQADGQPTVTVKSPRISAKMRRTTRAEFCDVYTGKADTKKGKPIAITASNMKRLHRLCSLSGDHEACPTYIINNLLSEFLDAVEPEAKKWVLLD